MEINKMKLIICTFWSTIVFFLLLVLTGCNSTSSTYNRPLQPTVALDAERQLQLTFISDRHEGYYGIYAVNIGCLKDQEPCLSSPELLYETNQYISEYAWSPDGHFLAFTAEGVGSAFDVFIVNLDSGEVRNITNTDRTETSPQWSPDGNLIAYTFQTDLTCGIRTSKKDGSLVGDHIVNEHCIDTFDWMKDGKIVYTTINDNGDSLINSSDLNGDSQKPVYQSSDLVGSLSASPDGSTVVFGMVGQDAKGSAIGNIFTVNVNGNNLKNLTTNTANGFYPHWSFTGNYIAFKSKLESKTDIHLTDSNGQLLINVSKGFGNNYFPVWR